MTIMPKRTCFRIYPVLRHAPVSRINAIGKLYFFCCNSYWNYNQQYRQTINHQNSRGHINKTIQIFHREHLAGNTSTESIGFKKIIRVRLIRVLLKRFSEGHFLREHYRKPRKHHHHRPCRPCHHRRRRLSSNRPL